jgi:recombination associated protein RdgC
MFKKAYFYTATDMEQWPAIEDEETLSENLSEKAFKECSAGSAISFGWIPPSPALHDNQLARMVEGNALITLQIEEKKIPGSALKKRLSDRIAEIEARDSRKVYAKEKRELKEEIQIDMLPRTHSTYTTVNALLMPKHNVIVVEHTSANKAEMLLNLLRETFGTLPVALLQPEISPASVMSQWLVNEQFPEGLHADVLGSVKLTQVDAEGTSTITLKNAEIMADQVKEYLTSGYAVTEIALANEDMLFTIKDSLVVSGIKPTDVLKDAMNAQTEDSDAEGDELRLAALDADIVLGSAAIAGLYKQINSIFCTAIN